MFLWRESNNSENKIIMIKRRHDVFIYGIKQQWKLNNNNKRTHDVFIRE